MCEPLKSTKASICRSLTVYLNGPNRMKFKWFWQHRWLARFRCMWALQDRKDNVISLYRESRKCYLRANGLFNVYWLYSQVKPNIYRETLTLTLNNKYCNPKKSFLSLKYNFILNFKVLENVNWKSYRVKKCQI